MKGIPSFPVRRSRRSMSNETPSRRAAICSETTPEVLGNGSEVSVPPAGLSTVDGTGPVFPPPQLPGPVGQQNMRAYRNSLLDQQWQRERSGISPGSERSREIQQQLNQP